MKVGDKIKVFAPATVANVACGFDVLGFAIDKPGDELIMEITATKGVEIVDIEGDGGVLPRDAKRNSATVAIQDYLDCIEADFGCKIWLKKMMPSGSGLGSSAASAVAGVFAINMLCNEKLSKQELMPFLLNAEKAACDAAIADNVAASLFGGFILVRSYEPLDILQIPVPEDLWCAVINPHVIVLTKEAREILPKEIPLAHSLRQSANVGGMMVGLLRGDYELIGRSMVDYIAEPYRSKLIPGFYEMKNAAISAGALGASISGSGPSVFALCHGKEIANKVGEALKSEMDKLNIGADVYVSKVNNQGPKVLPLTD
ncbi:MAG TPA: homoserine kinase [Chitinophagales bacterium]|jgi:homoserine kinase|nr:homoserine kinase [Chitinophagales bacterium]MBP6153262.1 homoserine kinase [Chitinophagales bacterium]HQV78478.1 homoserine kinase [Chitinophagales bacterium]HQW78836.1 homoserine kinase [Chitinophagales bacterium]HRB18609.1 homoserine kinase [Chitinophagales bacterium]